MASTVGFLALVILLAWYEVPRIRRYGGGRRELAAFCAMMTLAAALGVALSLRLPVPNPARALEAVFRPLGLKVMAVR